MDTPPIQYARTLIAQVVCDLCRGETFIFEDQGEVALKGFDEPVRAWSVGWTG
jgi:class 3 adenylate cyclase